MPKQLINIIGGLVVVLVLVLGIVLGLVPLSSQTGQIHNEATTLRQGNDIYAAQVRQLKSVDKKELGIRLSSLREQIPTSNLNDEVFELVIAAAASAGVTLESTTAAESEPWVTPSVEGEEAAPAAASEEAPADAPATGDEAAADIAAPAPAAPEDSSRKSVTFAVQVRAADISQAAAFVDALRAAIRLVRIDTVAFTQHAAATPDETATVSVSVTLRSLVFSAK